MRRHLLFVLTALVALGLVGTLQAGPMQESIERDALGSSTAPTLDVEQALLLTLDEDPSLAIARAAADAAAGQAQEARGTFDFALSSSLDFRRAQGDLLRSQIDAEFNRREIRRVLIATFDDIATDLEGQLERTTGRPVIDCRSFTRLIVGGVDVCLSEFDRDRFATFDEFLQIQLDEAEGDPERVAEIEELRRRQLLLVRQFYVLVIDELRRDIVANEEALRLLGEIPEIEQIYTLEGDFRLEKTLRFGTRLGVGVLLDGIENNFDGKELQGAFGGRGLPNAFVTFIGFTLDTPLGEGFGRDSAAAFERAAALGERAAALDARHAEDLAALRTLEAYWNLVAAEETVDLLRDAEAAEVRLLEIADGLIEGDLLPPALRARVEARLSDTRVSLARSEGARVRARMALADAIGLEIGWAGAAPRAAGTLPPVAAQDTIRAVDLEALALEAPGLRDDVAAARLRAEASSVLVTAAENDLARRVDLALSVGWSGLHESFEDDVWDPSPYWDALSGTQTGPSFSASITTDLPFGNRLSKARLERATALAQQSDLRAEDIARLARTRASELLRALAESAAQVERLDAAIEAYERTFDASVEIFQGGEGSIVDTVLTEEQLTFARLDAVEARRQYALRLARLKFELGRLDIESYRPGVLPAADS